MCSVLGVLVCVDACVLSVLLLGGIDKSSVDHILLVGGSSRIPKVADTVKAFFNGKVPLQKVRNAGWHGMPCYAATGMQHCIPNTSMFHMHHPTRHVCLGYPPR